MKTTIKLLALIVLLLTTTVVYSITWSQGPVTGKEKIIRTAVWQRTTHEIVRKNAYADETSCAYNAANCALDQIRKNNY